MVAVSICNGAVFKKFKSEIPSLRSNTGEGSLKFGTADFEAKFSKEVAQKILCELLSPGVNVFFR